MTNSLPALFDIFVKATALLALACLAAVPLGRLAALRRLVWILALAGVLAAPVLELLPTPGPVATWAPPSGWATASAPSPYRPALVSGERTGEAVADPSSGFQAARVGLVVWLVGAALALSQVFGSGVRLRRWRKRSSLATAPIFVIATEAAATMRVRRWDLRIGHESTPPMAMTWGCRHPVILLPREAVEWSEQRLRVVLLHEFAHVRGRDHLWRLIAAVATSLYWFHPLAWLAARHLRAAAEQAADDRVVAAGGITPPDYAQELVAIASGLSSLRRGQAVALADGSPLTARVRSILDPSNRHAPVRAGHMYIALLVGAGALLLIPGCRSSSVTPTAEADRLTRRGSAQNSSGSAAWPGEHFPITRLQRMDQGTISRMDYAQARYAVNEAYARHGVSFRKKPIREQFLKMTWYEPVPGRYEEASRDLLTEVEGPNVDYLETRLSYLKSTGQEMR